MAGAIPLKLNKSDKKKIESFIAICAKKQGEYLPITHGPGSWATTYSTDFVNASVSILEIYKMRGVQNPIEKLSQLYMHHKIKSCRGSLMTIKRVEYLYNRHLASKLKARKEQARPPKYPCPFCDKPISDEVQHVSQSHPDKWQSYSLNQKVIDYVQDKIRCELCGSFLNTTEGHGKKCLRTLVDRN